MQLVRLQITNFRGISQIDLSLDPNATALFGENNWGKTSLINALCRCLGSPAPIETLFSHDDFHRINNSRASIARRLNITLVFKASDEEAQSFTELCWPDNNGVPMLALRFAAERFGHSEIHARRLFVGSDGAELDHEHSDALAIQLIERHPVLRFRDMQLTDWLEHPRLATQLRPEDPELTASDAVRAVFERILTLPHQLHPQELSTGLAAMQALLEEQAQFLQGKAPQRLAEQIAAAPLNFRNEDSLIDIANRSGSSLRRVTLLILLGALLTARGDNPMHADAEPILVMEDPETHLHPIQLAMIWGLIEQLTLQKIITTNNGDLLGSFMQSGLRRLVRQPNYVHVYQLSANALSLSDARKVAFHIRSNRASSMFARVWLLVEGETEFWLFPELARISGVNFPLEGIRCVEFAQAGLAPLIKFADHLGIKWHVICDGDEAGLKYQQRAQRLLNNRDEERHITMLSERDIEHYLWQNGFADTFKSAAAPRGVPNSYYQAALDKQTELDDEEIINRALRYHSKPGMALEIAESAEIKGRNAIPRELQTMFETLQSLSNELN